MKNISFKKAIEKLEEIVAKLEEGNLSLETSLEQYEEGIKLVRICRDKLDKAKGKIETLMKKDSGMFNKKPFAEEK